MRPILLPPLFALILLASSPALRAQEASPQAASGGNGQIEPNVYTNQTNPIAPGSPRKAIGSAESANATVPFTIEALSLKPTTGGRFLLRLTLTNGSSGIFDPAGIFTTGTTDLADPRQITGVYLMDTASKRRFDVARVSETGALCTKIDPPLGPGERRLLEAQFPALPPDVRSVYVYFPHAAPIADVPVSR